LDRALTVALLVLLALAGLFFVLRPDGSSGSAADGSREQTFDLVIEDGAMIPDEIEVEEGDRVTLRLTSEAPVEVHLHGYDLEREVSPGETATLSFEAELTGRFEIEDHETGTELGVLLVQPR
jgi:FtsP/CotA-like multicopper oxidase with cupredoxin domain